MLPGRLNLSNKAAAGGTTSVALRVIGLADTNPVLLPVMRAWASTDDGNTWHRLSARTSGEHYVLSVHDPRKAGFVSLRIYVRDSAGASEQMTVIHAYGVR